MDNILVKGLVLIGSVALVGSVSKSFVGALNRYKALNTNTEVVSNG